MEQKLPEAFIYEIRKPNINVRNEGNLSSDSVLYITYYIANNVPLNKLISAITSSKEDTFITFF